MEPGESEGTVWNTYDRSFREDAHQLLAWGYQDARQLIAPDREETDITGFITEAIQARLSSSGIEERFDRYSLKDDHPIPGEGRTGKRKMRIDIIIESSSRPRHKPRPWYTFEAKRLCRPSHPISNYVGQEGIIRFVQGRYAADCPEVAMLGYVQTDTISHWITELTKRLEPNSANQLSITRKLSPVTVHPDLTDEWSSGHTRGNGTSLVIFHLFLDCS
jgi:hypothetical protein